ncbi:jg1257, partial [Pararge aegeria aegeria]
MEELPKKRKYIPESQLETQCDTDYEFVEQAYLEQNSQTYDDWEPGQENEDEINSAAEGTKKPTKDCATYTEISTKDISTFTENIMVEDKEQFTSTTVVDIHA